MLTEQTDGVYIEIHSGILSAVGVEMSLLYRIEMSLPILGSYPGTQEILSLSEHHCAGPRPCRSWSVGNSFFWVD